MNTPRWLMGMLAGLTIASALALPLGAAAQNKGIETEIAAVTTRLSDGQAANWGLIAPKTFDEARQKLAEANEKFSKGGKLEDIRSKLREATQKLNAVEQLVDMGNLLLAKAIVGRTDALAANAPKHAAKEWATAESAMNEAGREVEKGDQNKAREKASEALDKFRTAELQAIRADLLGSAQVARTAALAAGAEDKAPKTFNAAEALLGSAEDVLRGDRYQRAAAKDQARQATATYEHARYLSALADRVAEKNQGQVEALVTDHELAMQAICKSLNIAPDFSQGPAQVSESVLSALNSLQADRSNLQTELAEQATQLAAASARFDSLDTVLAGLEQRQRSTTAAMQAERERQQALSRVRSLFKPDEALVLLDGTDMIIRMHGLSFPVGSSEIRPENFQLLTKLQQALRVYSSAPVTIEGHTDAQGNDDVNQALSLRRATAVETYLMANIGATQNRFTVAGFGETKPIANNENQAGRALNRRIDVRIKTVDG